MEEPTVVADPVETETPEPITPVEPAKPPTEPVADPEITLPPPQKKSAQERINELTRKRHEAERRADDLERKLRERETPPTSDRPKLEHYETQEQYEDALFDWRDKRNSKEREVEQRRKSEETALERFNEKAKILKETYEDFDEIVEQPVFSPVMRETLLMSDEGAMVSYFLGRPENHDIADKISRLSPQGQIYELGKLETKLLLAQKTKKATDAPPPVKPVGITGAPPIDESNLSDEAWVAMDRKRTAEKKANPKYGG
jgi:hypothetical protein